MRVDVYWNTTKQTWSIRHKGRVIGHGRRVVLADAEWIVRPAGRERVRATGHKNVHAWVRGEIAPTLSFADSKERVRYNPYDDEQFHTDSGEIVENSPFAILDKGIAWRTDSVHRIN